MKVTVVGAGNVGATCANVLATREVCNEVVLLDIKEGFAEGKALDIWETSPINLYDTRTVGSTNDYDKTAGSDVVVITSGLPRKPGMSRDDLIATNAGIVKSVTEQIMVHSPDAILVIVSNPLDVMTYCAYLTAGVDSTKVIGMAGILDTARYRAFLAEELNVSPKDIQAVLMGGHGDTMVPLPRYTTVGGIPVTEMISDDKLEAIVNRTKKGGGEIVNLLGTSAWYAPGAAAAQMVEAIVKDQRRVFPACVWMQGEYGISDIYLGVPVILGKNGIEKVIELDLNEEERAMLADSEKAVREVKAILDGMN
ncbi:MAG TPA: malate dehydrogenase [Flavobacteriales bacterium]|jgi:malate dehydrogenase|nr:malate dehydrogenase [Flavobacteriales bacterium]HHZ94029.1 malate dehydrogenase [Flavobacteriales bacterium]HIB77661.1 malate dehydrogenase [Flavobacteriales bacterium]HIN40865.1 malate dehydrogenase [Flavobacteriales bacterium]HIO15919.1 malate dehydrogenase [Flavobacteriales bacterium]